LRLAQLKGKVVDSLHLFRFTHYTPHIEKCLGASWGAPFVSKVFPKPPVGKPRNRKRDNENEDEDDKEQSADEFRRYWEIKRVYVQAREAKTGKFTCL